MRPIWRAKLKDHSSDQLLCPTTVEHAPAVTGFFIFTTTRLYQKLSSPQVLNSLIEAIQLGWPWQREKTLYGSLNRMSAAGWAQRSRHKHLGHSRGGELPQAGLRANALRRHESSENGSSTSLQRAPTTNLYTTMEYRVSIYSLDFSTGIIYFEWPMNSSSTAVRAFQRPLRDSEGYSSTNYLTGTHSECCDMYRNSTFAGKRYHPNCFSHVLGG